MHAASVPTAPVLVGSVPCTQAGLLDLGGPAPRLVRTVAVDFPIGS